MEFKDLEIVKNYQNKDKTKLIEFIQLMYSQKSELNKINNLDDRREAACKKVKIDYNNPYFKSIIEGDDQEFNDLVFHFHVTQSSLKYHSLCTDLQLFWRIQKVINDPIDEDKDIETVLKKRSELSDLSQQLRIRVDALKSEIFATNDIIEHAERKIREMLTPEKRLKMNGVKDVH